MPTSASRGSDMRQDWLLRARRTRNAPAARRRMARQRRLRLLGVFGLVALLGVGAGQAGTTAVQADPRQVAVHRDHHARPTPQQRWGSAAGLDPVVDGPRNRTVPPSLRAKYPPIKAPALPANSARVVAVPAAHLRNGF